MDIDLLNSASEDEMEMIMTMPLDKLTYFCGPHDYVGDQISPAQQLPGGSSNSSFRTGPQMNDNSPTFMNLPSTISFGGVAAPAVDDDELQGQHFMSTGKWRGAASDHQFSGTGVFPTQSQKQNSMAAMREMIFRIAAMQPIHIDPESVKPPKRRNVKISKDPQSVAARHRRERISERIRILQRLVPGGTKMDTASMLDEAIHYVKFLKSQVQSLERAATTSRPTGLGFPVAVSSGSYLSLAKDNYHPARHQSVQQYSDA